MRRRKSDINGGTILLAIVFGVPVFLLMEHPVVFWLIFVPLAVFGIIAFVRWLKK